MCILWDHREGGSVLNVHLVVVARSSGMGFDLKCASCGRGMEPWDGASVLRVHLVVVARNPGEGLHSW